CGADGRARRFTAADAGTGRARSEDRGDHRAAAIAALMPAAVAGHPGGADCGTDAGEGELLPSQPWLAANRTRLPLDRTRLPLDRTNLAPNRQRPHPDRTK